ncbi:RcpC/CpaB family pilus assembly protein [Kineosporia mesophila]|nr:RcpC/CpaB family pilus assembly protein [Kineosporia mesophila]MCD5352838.1 RcpC/CpaB family pilus assembly protein [Kineosporia mesophila]
MLMLLAVWFTVRAAGPASPTMVRVMVASQDLSAGRRLSSGDLEVASWPAGLAPSGRLSADPAGQVLAAPVREGEALTDARLLGPGLLRGLPAGTVAVPVRLTDPGSAALVRAGDHVDVIAGTASTWSADEAGGSSRSSPATIERPARNALVLAVSGHTRAVGGETGGGVGLGAVGGGVTTGDDDALAGLLVLAVQAGEADRLAGAVTGASVSVVVLP